MTLHRFSNRRRHRSGSAEADFRRIFVQVPTFEPNRSQPYRSSGDEVVGGSPDYLPRPDLCRWALIIGGFVAIGVVFAIACGGALASTPLSPEPGATTYASDSIQFTWASGFYDYNEILQMAMNPDTGALDSSPHNVLAPMSSPVSKAANSLSVGTWHWRVCAVSVLSDVRSCSRSVSFSVFQASQCRDGRDNDGDGKTDWLDDSGCDSEVDETELMARPPTLSIRAASGAARALISDELGWEAGYLRRIRCGRLSRLRVRCRVSWTVGDVSYKGFVWIRRSFKADDYSDRARYRIRLTNHYCLANGDRHCHRLLRT